MENKNYNFQKLTPTKNVELKIYDDALKFVFDNNDIKNVAISGAYSAGKSSVVETYKSKNANVRFLHVSLAHFQPTDPNISSPIEYSETALEGKILNQLIHQIDPSKIPQTNFKVKQTVSTDKIIRSTAIITLFLILTAYIGCFDKWSQFVSALSTEWLRSLLLWTINSETIIIGGIIYTFLIGFELYSIIRSQKYRNIFSKVKVQGNEIEIFEEKGESYFDKYLNEVLYIFKNSNADVIVFEDMDRYDTNQIFEKLREINTLINNKKDNPIRFFYLIRDDIFVSKDRTKFFDFIIPIVPIIDGSNSYDQFIEHFKQGEIFDLFDKNFIQGLSLYVDDMRILKNIYNEFVIYHNRIQSTELNSNKLLAIISYKNIFPRDFSDLQLGLGFVHAIFESKSKVVIPEQQNIDLQIRRIKEEINLSSNEMLDSIDELDAVYLLSNHHIISVSSKNISEYKTRKQLVRAMKETPNNVLGYIPNSYGNIPIDMGAEFEQLSHNSEYITRKEIIERKTGNQIEKLKAEILRQQKQKSVLQNSRLREIITKDNIDTIFSSVSTNKIGEEKNWEEIKASPYYPLIKYLLRNGYIDETYPDYMTYFYENSLSRIDKIFLRSITDETRKEYSYSLKNPQLVLSRLRDTDFDHEEILNFDLLSHILLTQQNNPNYLKYFIQQLIETKNFNFIGEFLDTRRKTDLFIKAVNHLWPNIVQCILTKSDFSYEKKKQYLFDTLYFSTDQDFVALNKEDCISSFISQSPDFLDIPTPNVKKIIAMFSLIDVRFSWIEYNVSNNELFYATYINCRYQLNYELISLMLEKIYKISKSDDYTTKNYTLISSKPDEALSIYVEENINHYAGVILENCSSRINDEESAVLAILNNKDVDSNNKRKYISFLQTEIEHIDNVMFQELWRSLLDQNKVKYSEENILKYFFHSEIGLDSFLIKFINANSDELSFNYDRINKEYGDKAATNFYKAIIICNQLSNKKYERILFSLNRVHNPFTFEEIEEKKVDILIKLRFIEMTTTNLLFMRENYTGPLIKLITENIRIYVYEVINIDNFDFSEMISILEQKVDEKYKIELLKYTTEKISVQQRKYTDMVKIHILEHNLDVSDIPFLIKEFSSESDNVKSIIKQISIEHISEIIVQKNLMPPEFLFVLLSANELIMEDKKELFVIQLPNINKSQAKECLRVLQMNDFLCLFERKRPRFEINSINERILTIFQEKHWITKFKKDKVYPNQYRAYGRKKKDNIQTELL